MDATERTVSFGLNGAIPEVAFRDVDTSRDLYPCVMFYSSNSGEQVKISDFQVSMKAPSSKNEILIILPVRGLRVRFTAGSDCHCLRFE